MKTIIMLFLLILSADVASNGKPNPVLTPGTINPSISQDNIDETVCVPGYSSKIRPSSSYTNKLKKQQIIEYGYSEVDTKHYEEDHRVPLSVAGNPTDPHNLWPEPWVGDKYSAKEKDKIETAVHRLLCSGKITLKQAQHVFLGDWTIEYPKLLQSLK
jgi:hypothetical protein